MNKKEYEIIDLFFSSEDLKDMLYPDHKDFVLENILPELNGYTIRLRKVKSNYWDIEEETTKHQKNNMGGKNGNEKD